MSNDSTSPGRVRSVDVAKLADVSRTTVSYVLNGRTDVSIPEATRKRVLEAAATLGYRPNMAARALVSGRTRLISLWMAGTTIRLQSDVMKVLHDRLALDGHELVIKRVSAALPGGDIKTTPLAISDWACDGILAFNIIDDDEEPKPGTPVVRLGVYVHRKGDYVGVDLHDGSCQAFHHLVSRGRRKIAYLVNRWGNREGDARRDAYFESSAHFGFEPNVLVAERATKEAARKVVSAAFVEGKRFDAIIAFSDEMAVGAYRAVLDAGRKVPDDVALIGCDGIDDLEYMDPPISSVVQPTEQMCTMAWDFMKNRLEDPGIADQQAILQANLVIRGSSL